MQSEQRIWTNARGWSPPALSGLGSAAQVVFAFGDSSVLADPEPLRSAQAFYPDASFFGCTTSGEICGGEVKEGTLALTAVRFEATTIQAACLDVSGSRSDRLMGASLADMLPKPGLRHVFVLSDGLLVGGSDLVKGLVASLPEGVGLTGGMAGDGVRFQNTEIICGRTSRGGRVAVLGFYSDRLKVGYGSRGGWNPFGPERLVTKSDGNVLYELDGHCALDLYKLYLGRHADGLPAKGLLFPLSLRLPGGEPGGLVRTMLTVDEETKSLRFAGDIPEGVYARFMKVNMDRLVDGAVEAAAQSVRTGARRPELAILVSCVGRRLVLRQRVEEEVEAVQEVLGEKTAISGFYSYGEIAPALRTGPSVLHNQTMTVTTFSER